MERTVRINLDNIFIAMTESPNSSVELYRRFERLTYKPKVLFTINQHPEFPSTFCLNDVGKSAEV